MPAFALCNAALVSSTLAKNGLRTHTGIFAVSPAASNNDNEQPHCRADSVWSCGELKQPQSDRHAANLPKSCIKAMRDAHGGVADESQSVRLRELCFRVSADGGVEEGVPVSGRH